MDVIWAVWATDFVEGDDGTLTVWRSFNELVYDPAEYPVHRDLLIVGRLQAPSEEFGQPQDVEFRFYDADNNVRLSTNIDMIVPPGETVIKVSTWNFWHRFDAVLHGEGPYKLYILVNDQSKWELPLYVINREEESTKPVLP